MDSYEEKLKEAFEYSAFAERGKIESTPIALKIWNVDGRNTLIATIPLNRNFSGFTSPSSIVPEAIKLVSDGDAEIEYTANNLRIEFYDISKVTPEALCKIIQGQFEIANDDDLIEIKGCIKCGGEIERDEFYESDGVCPKCIDAKRRVAKEVVEKANTPEPIFRWALPFSLLLIPVGWALVFYSYYSLSEGYEQAGMPYIMIFGIAAILGILTGYPNGTVIRKSGLKFLQQNAGIFFLIAFAGALIGEYLAMGAYLFKEGYGISLPFYFRWITGMSLGGCVIKALIILGIFGGISIGAEKKKIPS